MLVSCWALARCEKESLQDALCVEPQSTLGQSLLCTACTWRQSYGTPERSLVCWALTDTRTTPFSAVFELGEPELPRVVFLLRSARKMPCVLSPNQHSDKRPLTPVTRQMSLGSKKLLYLLRSANSRHRSSTVTLSSRGVSRVLDPVLRQ